MDGLKAALTKVINEYGQKLKVLKENEKLSGEDVREGLTAVISVKLSDPQFEGQTKTKLGNSFMRTLVNKTVSEKLGEFFEENPKIAREIITKSINAQRAREAARNARELFRRKEFLNLPPCRANCRIALTPTLKLRNISCGGRFGGRHGQDGQRQAFSSHFAIKRKNPQCGEGQTSQSA